MRKHLDFAMKIAGALAIAGIAVPMLSVHVRDVWFVGTSGLLAGAISVAMVRGRLSWLQPAALALLLGTTALAARAILPILPIDSGDDRGALAVAVMVILGAAYIYWVTRTRFFAAARRSPFLRFAFMSGNRLGVEQTGVALTWTARVRRLRPLAMLVGALIYAVSFAIALLIGRTARHRTAIQRQVTNAVFGLGGPLFIWAKRRTALRGAEMRDIDRRAPVLLLRSFDDDMMQIKHGARRTAPTDLSRKGMTFERVIEQQLTPFGPVVAIGRPREELAPLGAARDYVADQTWQDEVEARIRDASIVVLILGYSAGLSWEMARIATLGQLHKLLVVFPPVEELADRWSRSLQNEERTGASLLPLALQPDRTLALIYADDLTPIVVIGGRDEWSYETAVRIGGMLAIGDGAIPEVP